MNYWAPSLAPDGSTEALVATVRFAEILLRPNGEDDGRVNGFMAAVIVVTNMRKTHRLRDTRHLVDVAQETVEIEIIADASFVAFKMGHIHRVEAYQRRPQANIRFRQLIARQVTMLTEDLLQPLQ